MNEPAVLTILLIDDYPIALKGLNHFLAQNLRNWLILSANHIANFCNAHQKCKPDVIMLGINTLNIEENLQNVKLCNIHFPSIPIIIYDHQAQSETVRSYFFAGVRGYILKENPVDEILVCIEQVMSGKFYMEPEVMNVLLLAGVKPSKLAVSRQSNQLSNRENEIAFYLSEGNGTAWIAQKLNLKPSTVSNTKRSIFTKLKVQNVIQLKQAMKLAADEQKSIYS